MLRPFASEGGTSTSPSPQAGASRDRPRSQRTSGAWTSRSASSPPRRWATTSSSRTRRGQLSVARNGP
eukprot:8545896-Alexandrium_andersonii.AAC.1